MNKDILERLEALLRRVKERAEEPRPIKFVDASGAADAPPTLEDGKLAELDASFDDGPQLEIEAEVEEDYDAFPDDDEEEPAPSSSPRPLAPPAERIERAAFAGDDEPLAPPVAAPPDSGKLPKASEAPPAFDDFEDITGVHAAPPPEMREPADESISLERSGEHRTLPRESLELVPEIARPEIEANDRVAAIVVAAQRFAPGTLGELLDATLGL